MELGDEIKELCYKIIGACMEVFNELGAGFPEEYYQRALEFEFKNQGFSFKAQKAVQVHYKDIQIGLNYLDFGIEEKVIIEIKSVRELDDVHRSQVYKYFASTEYGVALLVNFGRSSLEYERLLPPLKIQRRKNYKF